jgi:hypothetical protein
MFVFRPVSGQAVLMTFPGVAAVAYTVTMETQ